MCIARFPSLSTRTEMDFTGEALFAMLATSNDEVVDSDSPIYEFSIDNDQLLSWCQKPRRGGGRGATPDFN